MVELAAKNSISASPARTPVGTVTVWLVRLPLVAAAATKLIGVAGAVVTAATVSMAELAWSSVTVSVAVREPAVA